MNLSQSIDSSKWLLVENVRKQFGRTVALDGIDLAIRKGELFGLLGPNGAGKTTLLSILAGIMQADSGRVEIAQEMVHPDRINVRRLLGIAPQDLAIYSDLTAKENVRFFGQLYGLSGVELDSRVEESLRAVQLWDRADDRAGTFSGGMKRRLNLALAVVHRPALLLLDEPTTGVDPQSRNAIFEEVRRLNSQGATIIYTSHYMEEVQALCPRVGIIDHGRMVRIGPLDELLSLESHRIRFRLQRPHSDVRRLLENIPGVSAVTTDLQQYEVQTSNAATAVVELLKQLELIGGTLDGLEIQRPTLERVFLTLTGHALRD